LDAYITEGHINFLLGDTIELELLIDEEVAIHLQEFKLTGEQQLILLESGQSLFQRPCDKPDNCAVGLCG
jgi:hypothetical protein